MSILVQILLLNQKQVSHDFDKSWGILDQTKRFYALTKEAVTLQLLPETIYRNNYKLFGNNLLFAHQNIQKIGSRFKITGIPF